MTRYFNSKIYKYKIKGYRNKWVVYMRLHLKWYEVFILNSYEEAKHVVDVQMEIDNKFVDTTKGL